MENVLEINKNNSDIYKIIDVYNKKGSEENYQIAGFHYHKQEIDTCMKVLEQNDMDYELLWRASRAIGSYMETAFILQMDQWKDICREWGKKGNDLAEKAQRIKPDRVEAYVWQIQNIGKYLQATNKVIQIVKNKYHKKIKEGIEKAYELDKMYMDGLPILAKAILYSKHPSFGKKRAFELYKEFENNTTWKIEPYSRYPYAASLLLEINNNDQQQILKTKAKELLEHAINDDATPPRKYYFDWSKKLLKNI